jgi:phi LC3 family holin
MGVRVDNDYIMNVVQAVLGVLAILGVILDPTTPGISDK